MASPRTRLKMRRGPVGVTAEVRHVEGTWPDRTHRPRRCRTPAAERRATSGPPAGGRQGDHGTGRGRRPPGGLRQAIVLRPRRAGLVPAAPGPLPVAARRGHHAYRPAGPRPGAGRGRPAASSPRSPPCATWRAWWPVHSGRSPSSACASVSYALSGPPVGLGGARAGHRPRGRRGKRGESSRAWGGRNGELSPHRSVAAEARGVAAPARPAADPSPSSTENVVQTPWPHAPRCVRTTRYGGSAGSVRIDCPR
jgi:hypothetical protein